MKRILAAMTVALLAFGSAVSAKASPQTPQVHQLERTIVRQGHRIHNLEARRAYLHRYIRHMRHPSPPSYPSPSYSNLNAAQVAAYARGAGFPESVIPTMVAIAYRESHWNPRAVNSSSGACGLWQLYPCPGPYALDPAVNARLAFQKYQASGLAPWS